MIEQPLIIERIFNVPFTKVWQAITDKDQMNIWYFNLNEFKPEVGFEFQFNGGPPGKSYIHLCKITEVVVFKKLRHSWCYQGYPGFTYVTWELFAEGEKTKVRLTHEGLSSFPTDNPDFAISNFVQGWTQIVGNSLKDFLENN